MLSKAVQPKSFVILVVHENFGENLPSMKTHASSRESVLHGPRDSAPSATLTDLASRYRQMRHSILLGIVSRCAPERTLPMLSARMLMAISTKGRGPCGPRAVNEGYGRHRLQPAESSSDSARAPRDMAYSVKT